ncbi:hypothetical protein [Halomarina litorea]|nr:hypothetical protein [Halomarina sp. BCD28]
MSDDDTVFGGPRLEEIHAEVMRLQRAFEYNEAFFAVTPYRRPEGDEQQN